MKKITTVSWVLAAFLASGMATSARAAEDSSCLMLALDDSGSMAEAVPGTTMSRLRLVTDVISREFIPRIPTRYNVGLIRFNGSDIQAQPLTDRMTSFYFSSFFDFGWKDSGSFQEHLMDQVPNTGADGGTPLVASLQLAANEISGSDCSTRVIVALTDGQDSQCPDCVGPKVNELRKAGYDTYIVGFGLAGAGQALKSQLGDHFFDVQSSSPEQLKDAFRTIVGALETDADAIK